jgi:transposase
MNTTSPAPNAKQAGVSVASPWLGADVSKSTFDAALYRPVPPGQHWEPRDIPVKQFHRNKEGVAKCLAWLATQWPATASAEDAAPEVRVVMEATGKYSRELAEWFTKAAPATSPAIINPRLAKSFAESLGVFTRTDKTDARSLARYGADRQPVALAPAAPEIAELRDMTRYRQTLVEQRTAETNRAAEGSVSREVCKMQKCRLEQIERNIARLDKALKAHVDKTERLVHDVARLETIPGVGQLTAQIVLGEVGDLRRFKRARQMTSFIGLTPTSHDSGTSVHKKSHVSKSGSAHVRRILYLAALAATRGDNELAAVYKRLTTAGKHPMVALVAVMRKLLLLMRAVLVHEQDYQPNYAKTRRATCG